MVNADIFMKIETQPQKTCPRCQKDTLKKIDLGNGKYSWVCDNCGLKRGEMKPDKKKGVV
jgi:ribosomal protein L37AE/L43A